MLASAIREGVVGSELELPLALDLVRLIREPVNVGQRRFVEEPQPVPATSPLLWLLGPVERELFASGGRLALGIDGPGIRPDYGAL